MTTYLLDVNALIALVDPGHVQHDQAQEWVARTGKNAFATCPITKNELLRIVGHPRYPNSPGASSAVVQSLVAIRSLPARRFWEDKISMAGAEHIDSARLSSHSQVTETYLLALARANGGRLASMDRKLVVDAVLDGRKLLAPI